MSDKRNPLKYLNESFHQEHQKLAQDVLKNIQSIVIYKERNLSLWMNHATTFREHESVLLTDDGYDSLKEVAHLPILVLTSFQNRLKSKENDISFRLEAEQMLILMKQILDDISNLFLPVDQHNQCIIVERTINIIEFLINNKDKNNIDSIIKNYLDDLKPFLEYNKAKATQIQLEFLHKIISKWRDNDHLKLSQSRILIIGTHGPREGRIETQYFMKLYEEIGLQDVQNDFLYYIEALPTHMEKINIFEDVIVTFLGGAEVNKHIGKVVLGSSKGMFSDLLNTFTDPVLNDLI